MKNGSQSMRRLLTAILMLLFAGSCVQAAPGADGERFKKYAGKYPSALLKAEPGVKRRLQSILGASYSFFKERMQVEVPFENIQGILVGKGCQAHGCGSEDAALFIDLSDGKLHCAIRSGTYSDKVKTFTEDRAHFPSAALKYALE
jgi:hypothetical protein